MTELVSAFHFILEGANSQDGSNCGLKHLGYGLDYSEISFSDFGISIAMKCVMIAFVRGDAGGQSAATHVSTVSGELPIAFKKQ